MAKASATGVATLQGGLVDDLASLPELNEKRLYDELEARFQNGIIYTYIGDILLAVNPYRQLNIYTSELFDKYRHMTKKQQQPPHIFCMSDQTYSRMFRSGQNQCCVICGESGAGKTESTKLMIKHILHLCDQQQSNFLQKIIEVNPLLEAFGNAQTVMNNNSSRFGKYIELHFDSNGQVAGASVSDYLLEKSRVIQQAPGERNFHIFYYMFAGLDTKKLKINLLSKPDDHRILKPADGSEVFADTQSFNRGAQLWNETQKILDLIGFNCDEKESITAMLAAVIHIGDISFFHDADTDGSYVANEERLEIASILLGVEVDQFGAALTTTETTVPGHGEKIITLKSVYQAADGRDALAKALYGRLFGWIVRQINSILRVQQSSDKTSDSSKPCLTPTIGILDIYGFENFKTNSFEQLCINIVNEQLQHYFTQHVFAMELNEYANEGLKETNIQFDDNKNVVNLFFEAHGFYELLEEESKLQRTNDLILIEKFEKSFAKRPEFMRPKTQNLQFIVQHFAGPVSYCVSGFLEKNRDMVSANILECMRKSGSMFVADLFSATVSDTGSLNANDPRPSEGRKPTRRSILLGKPLDRSRAKNEQDAKKALKDKNVRRPTDVENKGTVSNTLSTYFKNSLVKLLCKMNDAEPQFIRCFRPNAVKQPGSFDKDLVLQQLRYTGVLQTIAIRRNGYSVRLTFGEFLVRYKFIAFPLVSVVECGPNNCAKVLKKAGIETFKMGKTKVFLKYYHVEELDTLMLAMITCVVNFQKYSRGVLARKLYQRLTEAGQVQLKQIHSLCDLIGNLSMTTSSYLQQQCKLDAEQSRPDIPERLGRNPSRHSVSSQSSSVGSPVVERVLEEAMNTMLRPDCTMYWGKLHVLSDHDILQKFLLLRPQIVVDGSETEYNGQVLGLKALQLEEISLAQSEEIGLGVEIEHDGHGNVFIKKLTGCDVIVRGYRCIQNNCLSEEVVQALGRLGSDKMKVFDMQRFKKHVADELSQAVINIPRVEALSLITFSFVTNCAPLAVEVIIVNFAALDLLGDMEALPELKKLSGLRLSPEHDQHLQKMWPKLQRRKTPSFMRSRPQPQLPQKRNS